MKQRNCRTSGEGLVVLIIFLAIIGGGILWLYAHKKSMDAEARAFGREAITKLAVDHDLNFYARTLGMQARQTNPPSQQQHIIQVLTEKGVPQQPIKIDEQVMFENGFFEPKGYFTGHLVYPSGTATMQIATSRPVDKWLVDDFTFVPDRPH